VAVWVRRNVLPSSRESECSSLICYSFILVNKDQFRRYENPTNKFYCWYPCQVQTAHFSTTRCHASLSTLKTEAADWCAPVRVHLSHCTLHVLLLLPLLLLLLLLLTAVQFSLGGSSPYTSTDKTNKNKYT